MDGSPVVEEMNDASSLDGESVSGQTPAAEEESIGIKGYKEYEEEMDTSDEEVADGFLLNSFLMAHNIILVLY